MPPRLEGIEAQNPQARMLDRVLDKAILVWAIGESFEQRFPRIVVPDKRIDRER